MSAGRLMPARMPEKVWMAADSPSLEVRVGHGLHQTLVPGQHAARAVENQGRLLTCQKAEAQGRGPHQPHAVRLASILVRLSDMAIRCIPAPPPCVSTCPLSRSESGCLL